MFYEKGFEFVLFFGFFCWQLGQHQPLMFCWMKKLSYRPSVNLLRAKLAWFCYNQSCRVLINTVYRAGLFMCRCGSWNDTSRDVAGTNNLRLSSVFSCIGLSFVHATITHTHTYVAISTNIWRERVWLLKKLLHKHKDTIPPTTTITNNRKKTWRLFG